MAQIAEKEGVPPKEIQAGIAWALGWNRLELARSNLLQKYLELPGHQIPMILNEMATIQKQVKESGGKGIPQVEVIHEKRADGADKTVTKTSYVSPYRALATLSKSALEWHKFAAQLEGLMQTPEGSSGPTQINISLPNNTMDLIYTDPTNSPTKNLTAQDLDDQEEGPDIQQP